MADSDPNWECDSEFDSYDEELYRDDVQVPIQRITKTVEDSEEEDLVDENKAGIHNY